jgi:hypothetical protein
MSCRNIIFCKPTGLNSNLVNLLVCNDYCVKNNYNLIFFIKEKQLEIAKQCNTIAQFIVVNPEYLDFSCGFNYRKLSLLEFSLRLKSLIKKYYIETLSFKDTYFHSGYNQNLDDISSQYHNILLYKIYKSELKNISKTQLRLKDNSKIKFKKYYSNILSFNLVNTGGDQKRVYDFWDYVINKKIMKHPRSQLFFVCGDKIMLERFTKKYLSINSINDKEYEIKYSSTFDSIIHRGAENDIFYDIVNCSFTNFQSLHDLRDEFSEITSTFKDVSFINRTEHFDFLVEYFTDNVKIL